MGQELEAKFRVEGFARVRRALRAAGAVYRGTAILTDEFFDTPDRELYREDRGLRLRRVRILRGGKGGLKSGWVLTYKGPRKTSRTAKVRREIETRVDDGGALGEVLRASGMEVFLRIEKRRTSYKLARCLIELDELPELGRFVEIEAPSEAALDAARRKLGLCAEPITDTYPHMIAAHRRREGR